MQEGFFFGQMLVSDTVAMTTANRNDDRLFAVFLLFAAFSLVTFGEISSKLAVG